MLLSSMAERDLPEAENLPVQHLVATLKNTTASYKFYWFLAILDAVRNDVPSPISFEYLLSRMVALAWHPNNFFRLSFGKADQLARSVAALQQESGLANKANLSDIANAATRVLADGSGSAIYADLWAKAKYVPYRFLAPWFAVETKGLNDSQVNKKITELSNKYFQKHDRLPMYRFSDTGKEIELQPRWRGYLRRHLGIVQSFVDWHLVQYVQRLNPNIPGIPNKLFAPEKRNLTLAREFWSAAGAMQCIYTGLKIQIEQADLNHFLPWSFVAHDLLWNIIPATPAANSAKSDALPSLERYLVPFARAQYAALHKVTLAKTDKAKLIEDYQILVTGQSGLNILETDENIFIGIIERTVKPQYEIARNMGFESDWVYAG